MTTALRFLFLLLAIFCIATATSCSSVPTAQQLDEAKAKIDAAKTKVEDVAQKAEAMKVKALQVSHETLDAVAVARAGAVAVGALNPAAADWSLVKLVTARSVLDRLEHGEQVTREELQAALEGVRDVVVELRKVGTKVEPVVDSALELVALVVDGS